MNPLILVLGTLSSILMVISALSVHRLRLLCFALAAGVVAALEYALIGAWTGFAAVAVGLSWTGLVALAYRYPLAGSARWIPIVLGAHGALFVWLTDFAGWQPIMLVPLVGGVLGTLAVFVRELIYTKALFFGIGAMWLGYEFANTLYTQMIGESINLVANTVALCALLAARRQGIPRSAMVNLDTQLLDTLTGAIHLPQPYRGIENRYPAGTLGGRKKPVRGAHPGSVGYARLEAEYLRARAEMKQEMLSRFERVDQAESKRG